MHGASLCSGQEERDCFNVKIVLSTLNFTPELTGIGKYSGEMASWLATQGHQVHVVTAPPYYPAWKVGLGYSAVSYLQEKLVIHHAPLPDGTQPATQDLIVHRCPLWVPPKPSGAKRLIHLASFALSSLPVMLRQIFWKPDVVWMVAPAFFCAPGMWLTAKLSGAPAWIHVQDYEVDAAFDLGLLKGKLLRRLVLAVERWMFKRFDVVSTISQPMLERAVGKGVDSNRLVLFPNWVDIASVHPEMRSDDFRAELGAAPDQVIALYSGNMGGKQGLEILAQAAALLQRNPRLLFVFCGNGAGRAELMAQCAGLPNVRFLDLQPLEKLGAMLASADIHLLPQRADAADLVMPSKLTGMLASGRAVVATAHVGTEVARVVEGCGLVVPPENPNAFADAIAALADDAVLRERYGVSARRYAEENLEKEAVLRRFEAQLLKLAGKSTSTAE